MSNMQKTTVRPVVGSWYRFPYIPDVVYRVVNDTFNNAEIYQESTGEKKSGLASFHDVSNATKIPVPEWWLKVGDYVRHVSGAGAIYKLTKITNQSGEWPFIGTYEDLTGIESIGKEAIVSIIPRFVKRVEKRDGEWQDI